jgi:hypothetical protein
MGKGVMPFTQAAKNSGGVTAPGSSGVTPPDPLGQDFHPLHAPSRSGKA